MPRTRADGYVLIMVPEGTPGRRSDGRMMEHRFVMQEFLGRPLLDWETVHHRDANREHNLIGNLELRVGPHGKGATEAHCATCCCFAGAPAAA